MSDGGWVDTTFDPTTMTAEAVAFGGERYFALLAAHPELGRYLALGDRVTVIAGRQGVRGRAGCGRDERRPGACVACPIARGEPAGANASAG